jgi:Thioredoxin reductase
VVSVIGGGNSAVTAALGLADFASRVYLIYRGDRLPAEPVWLDKLAKNPKIEVIKKTNIIEIKGSEKVEKVILDNAYNDKTYLRNTSVTLSVISMISTLLVLVISIFLR